MALEAFSFILRDDATDSDMLSMAACDEEQTGSTTFEWHFALLLQLINDLHQIVIGVAHLCFSFVLSSISPILLIKLLRAWTFHFDDDPSIHMNDCFMDD